MWLPYELKEPRNNNAIYDLIDIFEYTFLAMINVRYRAVIETAYDVSCRH